MSRLAFLLLAFAACGTDTARVAPDRPGVAKPGPDRVRAAVELGLGWLAAHQDADGRFDAQGFMKHDPDGDRCDGAAQPHFDVGVSGLATLAFLGAGYTDRGTAAENPHARVVRQALRYLVHVQDREGCFGPRSTHAFIYNHAIATLAMCEAFVMTRNPRYRRPAEDGLAFIVAARNPGAGWRYEPRGKESDTSVTAWCVTALDGGRRCGFDVPREAFDDALLWVDRMTDPHSGRVGYNYPGGLCCRTMAVHRRFPPEKSESLTAAGMWIRFLAGAREGGPLRMGAERCLAKPPAWDGASNDAPYWYFGTLAMRRVGGEAWTRWRTKLEAALLDRQHTAGARAGSWEPDDPWGPEGGRIYATALLTMCLEAAS